MSRFRQALIGTASAMALIAGLSLGAGTAAAEEAQDADALASIALDPAAVPAPIVRDHAAVVKVELETVEREALLADGTSFRFWTFNGTVPGPFVRARAGDTVEVTLKNAEDSMMFHSVDFHSVTGPGGGAVATQTEPGHETHFRFKAMKPGIYV